MKSLNFKNWFESQDISKCYYFGTFDPIHNDHVSIAKHIADKGHVIIFVPAGESPDKVGKKTTPHMHRVAMCKIIATKYGWQVEDIEEKLPKPSRSINTLKALEPNFDSQKTHFIMGADNVTGFHTWKSADELSKKLKIYALPRDGQRPMNPNINMDIQYVEPKTQNLSSTMIRKAIQERKPIDQWVDPDVADYIRVHNLYIN